MCSEIKMKYNSLIFVCLLSFVGVVVHFVTLLKIGLGSARSCRVSGGGGGGELWVLTLPEGF